MKRERLFKFKQFSVSHSKSAMKVGVDGVLIGAWADTVGARSILDAGCGCGLIALMAAQRNAKAQILAIDIDHDSIEEARENILKSPWAERVTAEHIDFKALEQSPFDLIISNPPFFSAGVNPADSARMTARHKGSLSPESLIVHGSEMLEENGKISQIFPKEMLEEVLKVTDNSGLYPHRLTEVFGREGKPAKRVLFEAGREKKDFQINKLILEIERGVPTEDYRLLTQDYYPELGRGRGV